MSVSGSEQPTYGQQRLRGSHPHKNKPQACTLNSVQITMADLPLCCPRPDQRVWDAHPRVYLAINDQKPQATCPYCSTKYELVTAISE